MLYGTLLHIYSSKNILIATHTICLEKSQLIINKEHFEGYRKSNQCPSLSITSSRLITRFQRYSNINTFINKIKSSKKLNVAHHLFNIANIFEYYDDNECILAMEDCINLDSCNYGAIKGLITNYKKIEHEKLNLFNITLPIADIRRDIGEYKL